MDADQHQHDPDVQYVVRKLGVSADEARTRLLRQDLAGAIDAAVERQLGDEYGGIRCDIAADTITVATTGRPVDFSSFSSDERLVGHLKQVRVEHSLARLYRIQSELASLAGPASAIQPAGIDVRANKVLVRIKRSAAEGQSPAGDVAAFIAANGAAIETEVVDDSDRVFGR